MPIHHIDGNPFNNDPSNLVMMPKKLHTGIQSSPPIQMVPLTVEVPSIGNYHMDMDINGQLFRINIVVNRTLDDPILKRMEKLESLVEDYGLLTVEERMP